ncbi:MAG: hypothetical protein PHD73_12365 [Sediminibacterium sp.]|nr:hypothetical protein [Sediminibacterium sp.]
MKRIILLVILAFLTVNTYAQQTVLTFEKEASLTRILNSISYYKVFETTDLAISIIVVGNESGSANMPETDEASQKVYIGVSEYDEHPKVMLYSIDHLYMPRDFKIKEKSRDLVELTFTHGPKLTPVFEGIKITSEGLTKLKL